MRDDSDNDLLPSFVLGRYRIEGVAAELGQAGVGLVIHAFDTRLKRLVTIYALQTAAGGSQLAEHDQYEHAFRREVDAASHLPFHTHLVALLDFETADDGAKYLVLEHLPGGTLAARLTKGPVPRAEALRIAADVARGLEAAHKAGIVHTRVSPLTIGFAFGGHAKLGNFGGAQIADSPNESVALAATYGDSRYLSPEQLQPLSPATDQYSLGLVLFEMLTGTAYKGVDGAEALELMHRQSTPIAHLLGRMLARRVDERYPSMDEVVTAIEGILSENAPQGIEDPIHRMPAVAYDDLVQGRTNGSTEPVLSHIAAAGPLPGASQALAHAEEDVDGQREPATPQNILDIARQRLSGGRS